MRGGDRIRPGQKVADLTPAKTGPAGNVAANTEVASPYDALFLEVLVNRGDVVQSGARILNVELLTGPRELVLYLPAATGKQVRRGMEVHISPSTASPAVYGYMLGTVSDAALFPSTEAGMLRLLDNPGLVRRFQRAAGDAPIQVHVALTPDPTTPSGYKWSSSTGPPTPVTAGMLAAAQIVLGQQRPISLVLPVFERAAGSASRRQRSSRWRQWSAGPRCWAVSSPTSDGWLPSRSSEWRVEFHVTDPKHPTW